MSREDALRHCRYYTGNEINPHESGDIMAWYWDMERVYVMHNGKFNGEREYYKAIGGKTYAGIPFDLLMVMFTSWGKWTYNIRENIGEFYKLVDEYLSILEKL